MQWAFPDCPPPSGRKAEFVVGVFPGQGIGPEVIAVAMDVLQAVTSQRQPSVTARFFTGAATIQQEGGQTDMNALIGFCNDVFARDGVVLAGPIGGRGVYELRAHFDLFCKLTPLCPTEALRDAGVIRAEVLDDVDILVVRENSGGIYMGQWHEMMRGNDLIATHSFQYSKEQVLRILRVAFALAARRRRKLTLVLKPGGLPSISRVWQQAISELAPEWAQVVVDLLEVDNAAFQLIQDPRRFDVVVTSNLFGDILSDCGGLLLGSRGMCYSGNYGSGGKAIYQTGHGAAHDLAGSDTANPIAQLHSLIMMLRASFGLEAAAARIETGILQVLAAGWRTPDIAARGSKVVGTRELGRLIVARIEQANF
jgi:3-isopropylmalate dehydrogenase